MIRNQAVRAQVSGSLVVAGLLFVLFAAFAPRVSAAAEVEQDLRKCVDGAWADYNECLVENSSSWGKKLCDIYFQAEVVLCGAKYLGEVKTAFSGSGAS